MDVTTTKKQIITTALGIVTLLSLSIGSMGCEKKPSLDKVRFEVGVAEPVAKLVTYEQTPPTDTSSKFHGIGEKGITTAEGLGIVLNIEPLAEGVAEPLDGELTASTSNTTIATVTIVKDSDRPRRRIVLLGQAPGPVKLLIRVDGHDNTNEIAVTVKPQ